MAENAPQIQYRQEMIAAFEVGQSLLRDAVTTEVVVKGNQAEFLVAGSGGATAVTRGINGRIPARGDSNTQTAATLVEWHDLVTKTGFNIFESQGNQRSLMQQTTMKVMNRRIDSDILTELATATVTAGAAATASLALCVKAKTILQIAEVPWDNQIYGIISPAFEAYMEQVAAWTSADYVDMKPLSGGEGWSDRPKVRRWLGVNWITHPNVPGVGTNSESCFLFHKSAIGHAVNTGGLMTNIGYDGEQDYSWARATCFMGTQLLQNSGVVKMLHDGSAYVGS